MNIQWSRWLGVALIVDTVDGPLARRVGVVSAAALQRRTSDRSRFHLCGFPPAPFSQSDLRRKPPACLPVRCHSVELNSTWLTRE
jgi:hypothetical protein